MRIVIAFRRTRSHLGRFLGGSAIVHGALVVALLAVPWTRQRVAPIENATVVALAGPIGGSAPAPPSRSAAAPRPEPPAPEPPKEAHTVREVPKPKEKEKEKEKPEPPKKKEPAKPAPPKPEPAPETTGREKPADTPSAGSGTSGVPGPGTATGVTASIGGGDSALGWYGAAVKAALESAWAKPYLEDVGQVYSVLIAFDIARDGSTRNVRVVEPSGVPSLDRSALRAVIEASPLPAVPPAWTQDVLPVTMRFNFNPETD